MVGNVKTTQFVIRPLQCGVFAKSPRLNGLGIPTTEETAFLNLLR